MSATSPALADSDGKYPVVDFDWRRIRPIDGDLHLAWKRAVEGLPDIFWSPRYGGHWVLTRAADMERVYQDLDHFSSSDMTVPPLSGMAEKQFRILPAESDPPVQRDYRRLLMPAFSQPRLVAMEAEARHWLSALIAEIRPRGGCEFVHDIGHRYPIHVFLTMAGLPTEDATTLLPLADAFTRGADEVTRGKGLMGMVAYVREQLAIRRQQDRDDVFSQVLRGAVEGRPVSDDEALGACCNLLFAGLDTLVAASSFHIRFLAANPGHRRQLVENPGLIPQAVEELLRYHGLTNLARRIVRDVEFGEVTLPAGDMVLLPLTIHGLDERAYPDPLTIDFHRKGKPNMIFGSGPHFCLGNRLARIELRILLELWLAALPDFAVDPDGSVEALSNGTNMVRNLPLVW